MKKSQCNDFIYPNVLNELFGLPFSFLSEKEYYHDTVETSEESMTVAIVSPYKAQVRYIQQKCLNHPF